MNSDIALKYIKHMRMKDGDTIVVRKWAEFTDEDRDAIVKAFKNKLSKLDGVTLLFVSSLSDIRVLNEGQMRKSGWIRAPRE